MELGIWYWELGPSAHRTTCQLSLNKTYSPTSLHFLYPMPNSQFMPIETRKYTAENITVVWKPKLCIHSAICFKGLPEVFDPKARPWVNINGADAQRIVEQVRKCPSGALSIDHEKEPTPLDTATSETDAQVLIQANGPLLLKGTFTIKYPDGNEEKKDGNVALCRCGASANKPYCDGSHRKIGFKD